MDYKQCIDYLFSLQKFGIKFGLSSTENLLSALGRPHDGLPCLHLAGTNGKGSVGSMICSMLKAAGYRVGFYTSPHLVTFRERYTINGEMISRDDVVRLTKVVRSVSAEEEPPTFFEFVTAMAFLYFAEKKVDLTVLETGMGGRLDATNVARPLLGVITNISVEHTDYLGGTLEEIAYEKAGIIKPGMVVVTGEKKREVLDVFEKTTKEKQGRLLVLGRDFKVGRKVEGFDYDGLEWRLPDLKTSLRGGHQVQNAALALAAVEMLCSKEFRVDRDQIRTGLSSVVWPGRAEILPDPKGGAPLMLDGAHNPAAALTLAETLKETKYGKLHMILGIMADKDIGRIMQALLPRADTLHLTRPLYSRAASPDVLIESTRDFSGPVYTYQDIPSAIEAARSMARPDDLIVVTGSLFTVGEARGYLTGKATIDSIWVLPKVLFPEQPASEWQPTF